MHRLGDAPGDHHRDERADEQHQRDHDQRALDHPHHGALDAHGREPHHREQDEVAGLRQQRGIDVELVADEAAESEEAARVLAALVEEDTRRPAGLGCLAREVGAEAPGPPIPRPGARRRGEERSKRRIEQPDREHAVGGQRTVEHRLHAGAALDVLQDGDLVADLDDPVLVHAGDADVLEDVIGDLAGPGLPG